FAWFGSIPQRFHEWRQTRIARAHLRAEARRQAKADRAALKATGRANAREISATGEDETLPSVTMTTSIAHAENYAEGAQPATGFASANAATVTAKAAAAAVGVALAGTKRSLWRGKATPAAESAIV